MKMESAIAVPFDGEVEAVLVAPGKTVDTDEVLVRFRSIANVSLE
jgi:biotin carboxyl carrier protein